VKNLKIGMTFAQLPTIKLLTMKKIILALSLFFFLTGCDVLQQVISTPTSVEVANGLKEALIKGVTSGTNTLSKEGGFFNNPSIRIPLPEEVQNVESAMRTLGLGSEVDRVIKTINEGAENASKEALSIFSNSIRQMTIDDAMGILKNGNGAATAYLKSTTSTELKSKFQPEIQKSLDKVGATKYWTDLINAYNSAPFVMNKINPDLNEYVTDKAMIALFNEIEIEENKIRQDPVHRTTDLLKRVFGYADEEAKKPTY
jgi:hypothetical protein